MIANRKCGFQVDLPRFISEPAEFRAEQRTGHWLARAACSHCSCNVRVEVAVNHQSLRIRSIVINRQDEVGFRKIVHRRLASSLQTARGYCKCLDGSVGIERNSKKLDSLRSVDDLRQGLWRIKSSATTLPGSEPWTCPMPTDQYMVAKSSFTLGGTHL